MVNCIPINDEKAHEHSPQCWCQPTVTYLDEETGAVFRNGPMVIHNSADQREVLERLIKEGVSPEQMWGVFED